MNFLKKLKKSKIVWLKFKVNNKILKISKKMLKKENPN